MAIGKNSKRMGSKKKGGKRKIVDPMTKKEWYDLRAPATFEVRTFGKTLVTRSSGLKIASEALKGRVVEVNLADLNKDEDQSYRKMRLRIEDVQGDQCLTNFYGMDFTRDRLCSLIKKWHSLIECWVDVKTADGYTLRMFAIGFTKRLESQEKKTSYAKSSQVRAIRKKMAEVMTTEASKADLKDLVAKFIPNALGQEIERVCNNIYPLENVYIRKVKVLKTPKFDVTKLMEVHTATEGDKGDKVEREEEAADVSEEAATAAASGGRLA